MKVKKMAKYSDPVATNAPENSTIKAAETEPSSATSKPRSSTATTGTSGEEKPQIPGRKLTERREQYLIAARRLQGSPYGVTQTTPFALLEKTIKGNPEIEIIDTIGPKNDDAMSDASGVAMPSVLIVKMTENQAIKLQQQASGEMIVEKNYPLFLLKPTLQQTVAEVRTPNASNDAGLTTTITVLGTHNAPLKDVQVQLRGSFSAVSGITNERGQATLTLQGETTQSVRSLHVRPTTDYWSCFQPNPDLSTEEENIVLLQTLAEAPSSSTDQVFGWGEKAMRLDQLPTNYRGHGTRIAVIDAGIATAHQDLRNVRAGIDVIARTTTSHSWTDDTIAHGTQAAGTLAGAANAAGIRGFAPDAEVHVCKVFPNGRTSHLIEALEYCVQHQIDIANLGVGCMARSEILEQQIFRARCAGVACFTGAGDIAGAVHYPASSPNVLAIAAIGKINEFPGNSLHVHAVTAPIDADGYFAAAFSCAGAEISLCAPGVAIISTTPPNNYRAIDGTTMAAAHVSGLAALVLAHHPGFQGSFKVRSADRVEQLFQVLQRSARQLQIGEQSRVGFGMPDALVAVGLQQRMGIALGGDAQAQAVAKAFASITPVNFLGAPLDPTYAAYLQACLVQTPITAGTLPGYMQQAPVFGRTGW